MFDTSFLDIPPLIGADGCVRLPGSKSISNRVLLLAALSEGTTTLRGLLDADDTRVMLAALRALGCTIEQTAGSTRVTGLAGRLAVHQARLFLGNAGTAMRPLAAVLALLAATQGGDFELGGVARMHERPIGDLVDALRALGCRIDDLGEAGFPPLRVRGGQLDLSRAIRVRGDVSSQFLTALLLALPLVAETKDIVVEVDGELISRPYVEITLALLARFGVQIRHERWQRFTIAARGAACAFRTPGELHVEGDASSASYFVALGAIGAADGRRIRIEGVGSGSIQGDVRFADAALRMGAHIERSADALEVRRGRWPLRALDLDCNHIPDAAMTLAVMALFADGTSRLSNIASWRVKETDRIAAMAGELRKLGATVVEGADFIEVTPPAQWRAATVHTYDDHRMAMCLALAALNPLAGASPGVPVRILDPRCVGKTFPDYFETLFGVAQAQPESIPVITVDGPSASGKGTLAAALAAALGFHYLDSGALYRATALAALDAGVAEDDCEGLARLGAGLALRFTHGATLLGGDDVTQALRSERVGAMASRISAWPGLRDALRALQLSFRRLPGLVADGRDMGTVIFPHARLKVFLTASAEERAARRHKQLISKGFSANIKDLLADLHARDARDTTRAVAPLAPAADALLLDNSGLAIETSVDRVLAWWQERGPFH